MNSVINWALFIAVATSLASNSSAQQIDFDELNLAENSFFDGYGSGAVSGEWESRGLEFNTNRFGPGWSYSNVDDPTTAGFGNQWAAITGSGLGGSGNYALANSLSPQGAFVNLDTERIIESVFVTNSTYAAISMRDGDSFAKPFGGASGNDPDFFKVIFTGFTAHNAEGSETGRVEFYLADYRFDDNRLDFIVDQWENVDLSGLGAVSSFAVSFEGSDVGEFGLNTPAYVAIDNISLGVSVPEPTSFFALASLVLIGANRRFRG